MALDQQLATEITEQLDSDILYFGWMVQIARLQNPGRAESENNCAVVDCVVELHSQGLIVVGNARLADGLVLIDAWPETGQNLRTRITTAIDECSGLDRAYCFWIQLTKHFVRHLE